MKTTAAPPVLELNMDPRYVAMILSGQKRMTTRRGLLHVKRGSMILIQTPGGGGLHVECTGCHYRTLSCLTARDAEREGFQFLQRLKEALLTHYPDLKEGDILTCVRFKKAV